MQEVNGTITEETVNLSLSGQIDSNNAPEVEKSIYSFLDQGQGKDLVIDASNLVYISSAGLRILLRIRKDHPLVRIINVCREVYDVFEMTGFTQMMDIEKAYRVVSVEGCEIIGKGANGSVYRIDQDNVVKVYEDPDSLDEIIHEREVAKLALILGVPTAISYDVVKVGDSYGSVFELLNAQTFANIIGKEPEKTDWCVKEYVSLLKKIHGTLVPEGKLPEIKDLVLSWANFVKDYLPEEPGKKLVRMVEEVPRDQHMIHGDYHLKNIVLSGDEVLLIDMDTLSVGYPIFEFGSIYNAFIGFSEFDHENVRRFMGFDFEISTTFWKKALAAYMGTDDEAILKSVENKARIIGYSRLIRREIRRKGQETEDGKARLAIWKGELLDLLEKTDSLLIENERPDNGKLDDDELDIEAEVKNLPRVLQFVENALEKGQAGLKNLTKIAVAVEEVFVNIANYAYKSGKGRAQIRVRLEKNPLAVLITFIDTGMPYDPLAKKDPDITLSAEERQIGGLGIYMIKNIMDDVIYEYSNGKNILTIKKLL